MSCLCCLLGLLINNAPTTNELPLLQMFYIKSLLRARDRKRFWLFYAIIDSNYVDTMMFNF